MKTIFLLLLSTSCYAQCNKIDMNDYKDDSNVIRIYNESRGTDNVRAYYTSHPLKLTDFKSTDAYNKELQRREALSGGDPEYIISEERQRIIESIFQVKNEMRELYQKHKDNNTKVI